MKRSEDLIGEGHAGFYNAFSCDVLFTGLIIGLVALVGLNAVTETYTKSLTTVALGNVANHKAAVTLYYSLHGTMPTSLEEIDAGGIFDLIKNPEEGRFANDLNIIIEDGAIHVPIKADSDKLITWRPAVLQSDPLSSVIWVAGDFFDPNRWRTFGPDRTNIPRSEIHEIYYTN